MPAFALNCTRILLACALADLVSVRNCNYPGTHSVAKNQHKLSKTPVLYHDYFAIRGGGERLILTLAEALDAELFYGFNSQNSFPDKDFPPQHKSLNLATFLRRPGIRPIVLAILFRLQRGRAQKHAIRLFSGVAAPFAAPKGKSDGKNIFYCHTPPRFLFDQKQHFIKRIPLPLRIFAWPVLKLFEYEYRRTITQMHTIITNSQNTRRRLKKYTGYDSEVIYPPIETDNFVWKGQSDYYLSTARLSPLKRVERIVESFLAMPDKKLIVASGGEDLEALQKRAKGAKNIQFCGWTSDQKLHDLIGNAIATIYLPREEDFGMSPVESMAAGKPVIGVAEGGLLETIVDGKTGILLPKDFTNADLVSAVQAMSPARAKKMRTACTEQAKRFSRDIFIKNIRAIIERP